MRLMLAVAFALIVVRFEPQIDPAAPSRQQAAPQAPVDSFNAPDIFDADDPGIHGPRVIKDVKPNYTSAAMRKQISGLVVMEAVVERDGSVGPLRILHSLDPQYGLDDEAVKTIRQWRFEPATKDGQPVRARIVVEMSFVLRDSHAAELNWPPEFPGRRVSLKKAAVGFVRRTVSALGLRITIAHPPDWQVTSSATAHHLITVSKDDQRGLRSVSVFSSG